MKNKISITYLKICNQFIKGDIVSLEKFRDKIYKLRITYPETKKIIQEMIDHGLLKKVSKQSIRINGGRKGGRETETKNLTSFAKVC